MCQEPLRLGVVSSLVRSFSVFPNLFFICKDLFFKPVDGFGGTAAYRGDKLTRKAFEHVLSNRYVAQAIAPTSSRRVQVSEDDEAELRVDVRNFAMGGETWLRAARLYRGQTTNFRTAGGGFAPVLTVPA